MVASALKSGEYKVRGITRNVNTAAAKDLTAQGVEMVAADTSDLASLVKAFEVSGCEKDIVNTGQILTYVGFALHLCCHRLLRLIRYAQRRGNCHY